MAVRHFGVTVATLDADEFYEVVFDWIPRKVAIPPSEAKSVVEELHAFYRFLQREYDLPQAEACLSVLTPKTAEAFEESLGNEELFDPSKRILEEGRKRGFDVESPEGAEAWFRTLQDEMAEEQGSSTSSKASKAQAAKRKAKRKASRKARRKKR